MSAALAAGFFFALIGLAALVFGLYALARGSRNKQGGIGPLSERGVHIAAGVRMTLAGAVSIAAGLYMLWRYFG